MSRKLLPKDLEAINKLRNTIQSDSYNSSNQDVSSINFDSNGLDQFHLDLLSKDKVTDVKINGYDVLSTNQNSKQFAIYEIEVTTVDVVFEISRRFSEFHALFKRIRKNINLKCQFPKKVYNPFISSTHQSLMEQRLTKLNLFLKQVLNFIKTTKDSNVSLSFFTFLAVKEYYQQKKIINNYKKSNSEKLSYHRMATVKPSLSEGFRLFNQEESLEFKLILLNQNIKSQKYLQEIEQFIKIRKNKISNQDVRTLLLGFDNHLGLIRYSLTNQNQINRINALELILNLLSPQKNPHFQKIQRIIQKISIQQWKVKDIHSFDNPVFKILYFKLLKIFSQKLEKESKQTEQLILKQLFQFHQNLSEDYCQWKKLSERQSYWRRQRKRSIKHVDQTSKIQIIQFEEDQPCFLRLPKFKESSVNGYISFEFGVLAFYFQSDKFPEKNNLIQWNRYASNSTINQYTSLAKSIISFGQKRFNLKIKYQYSGKKQAEMNQFSKIEKLLKQINEIRHLVQNFDMKIQKEQNTTIQSEYFELILLKNQEGIYKMAIAIALVNYEDTSINLEQMGRNMIEDLSIKFLI